MNGGGAVGGGDTDTDTDNDKNVVIFLGPETEHTGGHKKNKIGALMHIESEDTNHFCTLNISFFAKELQEYFLRFYFWVNMFIVLFCVSVI